MEVIFVIQSAVVQVLGFGLGLGLLLNVCGIGYHFSRADGLIIKPISEFRQENAERISA